LRPSSGIRHVWLALQAANAEVFRFSGCGLTENKLAARTGADI